MVRSVFMCKNHRTLLANFSCFFYSLSKLRENVQNDDAAVKQKEMESGPKASYGYGGKFGVQKDRMDKVQWKTLQLDLKHIDKII